MNTRRTFQCAACLMLLSWLACHAAAQSVRVTTFDLASGRGNASTNEIPKAAAELRKAAPDVILLRGVTGWKMCSQLVDALKPAEYRVAICSSFRDATSTNAAPRQIAILSRTGSYFSWSEPWSAPTNAPAAAGFAFAAI